MSNAGKRRVQRNQEVSARREVQEQLEQLSTQQLRVEKAKMGVTNAENRMQLLARCTEVLGGSNIEDAPDEMQEAIFYDAEGPEGDKTRQLCHDVREELNASRIAFAQALLNYLDEVKILLDEGPAPAIVAPSTADVVGINESKA
jgi:hypothetical protein